MATQSVVSLHTNGTRQVNNKIIKNANNKKKITSWKLLRFCSSIRVTLTLASTTYDIIYKSGLININQSQIYLDVCLCCGIWGHLLVLELTNLWFFPRKHCLTCNNDTVQNSSGGRRERARMWLKPHTEGNKRPFSQQTQHSDDSNASQSLLDTENNQRETDVLLFYWLCASYKKITATVDLIKSHWAKMQMIWRNDIF